GHVGRVEPRGYDGIHCRWFHARSHARLNDPSGRNAPRRWPRQASSVSGKSSRQWAPRVSVRAYAAATTAVATGGRLAYSHAAVPAPGGPARRTSSAAARSRVSALRSTPAPALIACCNARTRSGGGGATTEAGDAG